MVNTSKFVQTHSSSSSIPPGSPLQPKAGERGGLQTSRKRPEKSERSEWDGGGLVVVVVVGVVVVVVVVSSVISSSLAPRMPSPGGGEAQPFAAGTYYEFRVCFVYFVDSARLLRGQAD